jgi:hypothetical protein
MDYEPKTSNLSLEERLADGQIGSLDEVEDRVVVMLRQLGVEALMSGFIRNRRSGVGEQDGGRSLHPPGLG